MLKKKQMAQAKTDLYFEHTQSLVFFNIEQGAEKLTGRKTWILENETDLYKEQPLCVLAQITLVFAMCLSL